MFFFVLFVVYMDSSVFLSSLWEYQVLVWEESRRVHRLHLPGPHDTGPYGEETSQNESDRVKMRVCVRPDRCAVSHSSDRSILYSSST